MFEKARPGRDAFTFSLGGMTAISSFMSAPAIADDRINTALSERLRSAEENCVTAEDSIAPWGRLWLRRRRHAV